jgi:hypothetical protein
MNLQATWKSNCRGSDKIIASEYVYEFISFRYVFYTELRGKRILSHGGFFLLG